MRAASARAEPGIAAPRAQPVYAWLGLGVLAFVLLGRLTKLGAAELDALQGRRWFELASGGLLAAGVLSQWYLPIARIWGTGRRATAALGLHKALGLTGPALFWIHTARFGYGYVFLLSVAYHLNFVLGLFLHEVIRVRARWYAYAWLVQHVLLSSLITVLVAAHGGLALYFE